MNKQLKMGTTCNKYWMLFGADFILHSPDRAKRNSNI